MILQNSWNKKKEGHKKEVGFLPDFLALWLAPKWEIAISSVIFIFFEKSVLLIHVTCCRARRAVSKNLGLWPQNRFWDCGAYTNVEKRLKSISYLQVKWFNLSHKINMIWISHRTNTRVPSQIFDWFSKLRKIQNKISIFEVFSADKLIRESKFYPQVVKFLKLLLVLLRK